MPMAASATSYLTGANVSGTPGNCFHVRTKKGEALGLLLKEIGQDTRYPVLVVNSPSRSRISDTKDNALMPEVFPYLGRTNGILFPGSPTRSTFI